MEVAGAPAPVYQTYSYKDRADRYLREFARSESDRLRAASDSLSFQTLRDQIRHAGFVQAELYVTR